MSAYETEASRLFGTNAYFRSEEVWEEESYYNGWVELDRQAMLRAWEKLHQARPPASTSTNARAHPTGRDSGRGTQ